MNSSFNKFGIKNGELKKMRKEEILRSLSLPQNDGISRNDEKDYASAPLCAYASGDLRAKAEAVCDMFKLFAVQRSRRGSRLMRGGQDKTACPLTFLPSKKAAFTLAEVLISLAITGIVAAMTIPGLLTNIKSRIKNNQIEVIERKFNKGTDLLAIQNGIGSYYNDSGTLGFVNELSKYLKITRICDNNNLKNCFNYDKLTKRDGSQVDISSLDLTKSPRIALNYGEEHDFGETVGIILADGTPMLLTFDKKCKKLDPDVPNQNTSSCVSGIYDINGAKGPNKIGSDIITFNGGCYIDLGNICLTKPFKIEGITNKQACESMKVGRNTWPCSDKDDIYVDLLIKCGGYNNIASPGQLANFASKIYTKDGESVTLTSSKTNVDGLKLNEEYKFMSGVTMISRSVNYNNQAGDSYYFGDDKFGYRQYGRWIKSGTGMCIAD